MSSKTEICNLALSHLGIGKEVANIETERSQEAYACKRFFDISREMTLKDIDWPFASKFSTLGLVEESPTDEWQYSYRYPVGCLYIRRILSGLRNDTLDTLIPYKIVKDTSGKLIYTDQDSAMIEFTEDITDVSLYTPEFIMALSFRLAVYVAPRLTGGDPFKLKNDMMAQYEMEIDRAKQNALNEERNDKMPESELVNVRY